GAARFPLALLLAITFVAADAAAETLSNTFPTDVHTVSVAVNASTGRVYLAGTSATDGRPVVVAMVDDGTQLLMDVGVTPFAGAGGFTGPAMAVNAGTNRVFLAGMTPDQEPVLAVLDGTTLTGTPTELGFAGLGVAGNPI